MDPIINKSSIYFIFLIMIIKSCCVASQTTTIRITDDHTNIAPSSTSPSSSLDSLLASYAFKALVQPQTGALYLPSIPTNFSGIRIAVARLRRRSFETRGFSYAELYVPPGVFLIPTVERHALVYQNLGNHSALYFNIVPEYTLITQVIGFRAYDATNLTSSSQIPELALNVTGEPITVNFSSSTTGTMAPSTAKCVWFDVFGTVNLSEVVDGKYLCKVRDQGHFAIVMPDSRNQAPASAPPAGSTAGIDVPLRPRVEEARNIIRGSWEMGIGGGVVGLVMLVVFVCVFVRMVKVKKRLEEMEKEREDGESLGGVWVGRSKMPLAAAVRTVPLIIENY